MSSSTVPTSQQQIKQYLRKHKKKWSEEKSASGDIKRSGQSTGQRSLNKSNSYSYVKAKPVLMRKGRTTIDHLPDEVLYKIFSFFGAHHLLLTARVCKRWNILANDNLLWAEIFKTYAPNKKKDTTLEPENIPFSFWKSQCIKRCSDQRNKDAFRHLRKLHPYTGLPRETNKILERCGIQWVLVLQDSRGEQHEMRACGNFPFCMSSLVRWYSLQSPSLREIRKIQVYSINPLFFERGRAVANSPYQRSLLLELELKWDSWVRTNSPTSSDDLVNLYLLPQGVMLATWKGDGELAFVAACLHHHQLVQRCLYGTRQSAFIPTLPKPVFDDVDKTYGLHDYSCTMELHHQRQSIWNQQFRRLHCKRENLVGGYAFFDLIRPDYSSDHSIISQKIVLPWKTDAFKGRLENVTILDMTILDEQGHPFWCLSSPVSLQSTSEGLSFDYSSDGCCCIKYVEPKGKVVMELNWSPDREQYFVTRLLVAVSLQAINDWFGTLYK
ncbi:F-box only protein 15-like [Liolophura sinensis]|uniref:F-box only protein 15-like n=1 Tax=Liolophura sinensis TaxID=3198878 RepID=UPI003159207D